PRAPRALPPFPTRRSSDLAPAALLDGAEVTPRLPPVVALLGVRGAGKSTVGAEVARHLGTPFVELDQRIEQAAGLSLGEIFELRSEEHTSELQSRENLVCR